MAELVGAVASGISIATLAVQVGRSIRKLKDCWNQVEEAPGSIKLQILQLEQLSSTLQSIEDAQTQNIVQLPPESIQMCKVGADELSALVNEFDKTLEAKTGWRKRKVSLKVILKKEDIKKLKERLNEAIQLLQLACHCQTNAMLQRNAAMLEMTTAMIQAQPNIIIAEISKTMTPGAHLQSSASIGVRDPASSNLAVVSGSKYYSYSSPLGFLFGSLQYQRQYRKHKGKLREEFYARYKLPAWYSHSVWDTSGHKTYSGWQFNLRTYRAVKRNSPFIKYIIEGKLTEVQKMLENKEGFVTDRVYDYYENTPLHIAAQQGHLEICRLLLDQGADVLAVDDGNWTPLHYFSLQRYCVDNRDLARLLINAGAADALIEDASVVTLFQGSIATLSYLQQQTYPPYYEMSIEQRFKSADNQKENEEDNAPELLKMSLCADTLTEELVMFADQSGLTLLHHIMEALITAFTNDYKRGSRFKVFSRDIDTAYNRWRGLAREVITTGASLHAIDKLEGNTPFKHFLSRFWDKWHNFNAFFIPSNMYRSSDFDWHKCLQSAVNNWVVDLSIAGVDLQQYGAAEYRLHLSSSKDTAFHSRYFDYARKRGWPSLRLISFVYGPRPEDWKFWFSEPTDEFAGDFWALVEKQKLGTENEQEDLTSLSLPGAWIDGE